MESNVLPSEAGLRFLESQQFSEAVRCFGEAISQSNNDNSKIAALSGRAQAYVGMHCFAQGLADATTLVALQPDCVGSLSLKGVCEDKVGLHRRSASTFAQALAICDRVAVEQLHKDVCGRGLRSALQHMQEQVDGKYNWLELYQQDLASLTSGRPTQGPIWSVPLPTVTFCRSCEVQFVPGRGRGLVTIEAVPEGALLFATKAFSLGLRSEALRTAVAKLRVCPQIEYDRFFSLSDGSNEDQMVPEAANMENRPVGTAPANTLDAPRKDIDISHVKRILDHNAHTRETLDNRGMPHDDNAVCGLWPLASMMNHSCLPNVQRTFVGDMLVCRAARPLCPGTELLDHYVTLCQPMHLRQETLKRVYGFVCTCSRCVLEGRIIPIREAKKFVQQGTSLCQLPVKQSRGSLTKVAQALESLTASVEQMVGASVTSLLNGLTAETAVQQAFVDVFGFGNPELLKDRLQALMCASFAQLSMSAAFAWEQLANLSCGLATCLRCCKQLEELCPNNVLHARYAAQRASLTFKMFKANVNSHPKINSSDVGATIEYARHCFACCYGKDIWTCQIGNLGWPEELCAAHVASPTPHHEATSHTWDPSSGACVSHQAFASLWEYVIAEVHTGFFIFISIPQGVHASSLDLDISNNQMKISFLADVTVHIQLARAIDAERVPPATFSKHARQLILELPFPCM